MWRLIENHFIRAILSSEVGMTGYWWQCETCGGVQSFQQVCNVRSVAAGRLSVDQSERNLRSAVDILRGSIDSSARDQAMRSISTEVLVIGGGPVGLSTALHFNPQGIDCVLVEKHASTATHPEPGGMSHGSSVTIALRTGQCARDGHTVNDGC